MLFLSQIEDVLRDTTPLEKFVPFEFLGSNTSFPSAIPLAKGSPYFAGAKAESNYLHFHGDPMAIPCRSRYLNVDNCVSSISR